MIAALGVLGWALLRTEDVEAAQNSLPAFASIGQLFVVDNGVCTAQVVSSRSRRVAMTAARRVYLLSVNERPDWMVDCGGSPQLPVPPSDRGPGPLGCGRG
ncbi:hypothetical protein GCM10009609_26910 [Pseudonocardia aurantiaca]